MRFGGLPCCGYGDYKAVNYNPFNRVVQCHNCGTVYLPQKKTEYDPPV